MQGEDWIKCNDYHHNLEAIFHADTEQYIRLVKSDAGGGLDKMQ